MAIPLNDYYALLRVNQQGASHWSGLFDGYIFVKRSTWRQKATHCIRRRWEWWDERKYWKNLLHDVNFMSVICI